MEKYEQAIKLIEEKVKKVHLEDEVYTIVHDKAMDIVQEVEEELGYIDDDNDGAMWYDDILDDAMVRMYEKLGKWLGGYVVK